MIHLFNWHNFLILNVAIALSYCVARIILLIPAVKNRLSQQQQLRFARFILIASIFLFLLMPYFSTFLPSKTNNFEFEPFLHHASHHLIKHETIMVKNTIVQPFSLSISWSKILFFTWLTGCLFFLSKAFHALFRLHQLRKKAFCKHKIFNTHVLFTNVISIPFCWSWLEKHYICIPTNLLQKYADLRLAIRHELQHIRQGDTYWLHLLTLLRSICFINPFSKWWAHWLNELQEFACDEALVLQQTSTTHYAQCLLNTASNSMTSTLHISGVVSMNGMKNHLLNRRITMLFNYKNQKRVVLKTLAYLSSLCLISTAAYAVNSSSALPPLSAEKITKIVNESHLSSELQISVTPEVVKEINRIRMNEKERQFMLSSLQRMAQYKLRITDQLKKNNIPNEFLALPLVESGYRPLKASENPVHAAGIWQFIPSTAKEYGLVINSKRDDRLNVKLETQAAMDYLKNLYTNYKDWNMALISYELGEQNTEVLMEKTKSKDIWSFARSPVATADLQRYVTKFTTAVILIHNPKLLNA